MARTFRVGFVGDDTASAHVDAVRSLIDAGAADIEIVGPTASVSLDAPVAAGANLVHVVSPPTERASVAVAAMDAGCDVFVAAPLAESVDSCESLEAAARRTGRMVAVEQHMLFDPQIAALLDDVTGGKIGRVVSVDITVGGERVEYEGGPPPTIMTRGGQPLREIAVHYLPIVQTLLGPIQDVDADWQSLGGERSIPFDEWSCRLRCRDGVGQLCLSYNSKRHRDQIVVTGTTGVLTADMSAGRGSPRSTSLPAPLRRLARVPNDALAALDRTPIPLPRRSTAARRSRALRANIVAFYEHVRSGNSTEITLADARDVVRHIEEMAAAADAAHEARLAPYATLADSVDVLVTGASGTVGRHAVQRMIEQGRSVRAFVRRPPGTPIDGVEYAIGNLGDPEAVRRAVRGARIVIHAGATVAGSAAEHLAGTVVGTRNVVDACVEFGVDQLVHVSSMSVVDRLSSHEGTAVDERSKDEPHPERRGSYTQSKLAAEKIVREAIAERALPAVILRPGSIFGGGIDLVTGAVARRAGGRWLILGDGDVRVSLVYIEDVTDAIGEAVERGLSDGEVIQLIDPTQLTQNEVLAALGDGKPVVHIPRGMLFTLGRLTEPVFGRLGKESPLGKYRLQSALAKLRFDGRNAEPMLGWAPRVGVREGIRRFREESAARSS